LPEVLFVYFLLEVDELVQEVPMLDPEEDVQEIEGSKG
jgi:hypothetical protein